MNLRCVETKYPGPTEADIMVKVQPRGGFTIEKNPQHMSSQAPKLSISAQVP